MEKKVLFPFTRIHNPMLVEAHMEEGKIKEAYISDTLYRGFEQILVGRPAMDMPYYTERICGICSSAHAITSALAVEQALGMQVPSNGQWLRNLILAGDFLQNHIRHTYLLALPDYFRGPDLAPFVPHLEGDDRLSEKENKRLTDHYFKAIEISRLAHAAFGVFGGKAPHGHGIVPGGITMDVDTDKISRYRGYLEEVQGFINDYMLPDLSLIIEKYPDYIDLGKGIGNYFSVGGFRGADGGNLFPEGTLIKDTKGHFNEKQVTEDVTTAWYKQTGPLYPGEGETIPDRSQPKGYTWVKAPRYEGLPMEVGPLARFLISGEKVIGQGAVARLWARGIEAKKIGEASFDWLERLVPGAQTISTKMEQESGIGVGLHEAMRGALGHWVSVKNGRVENYQIVTPSAWNFSCRDEKGTRSVGEASLIDLEVKTDELKEAGRVLRSYDPCFSCTVHLLEGENVRSLEIHV